MYHPGARGFLRSECTREGNCRSSSSCILKRLSRLEPMTNRLLGRNFTFALQLVFYLKENNLLVPISFCIFQSFMYFNNESRILLSMQPFWYLFLVLRNLYYVPFIVQGPFPCIVKSLYRDRLHVLILLLKLSISMHKSWLKLQLHDLGVLFGQQY